MSQDVWLRILYRERWRSRRAAVPEGLRAVPDAAGRFLGRLFVALGERIGKAAARRTLEAMFRHPKPVRPWWIRPDANFASDHPEWWIRQLAEELAETAENDLHTP